MVMQRQQTVPLLAMQLTFLTSLKGFQGVVESGQKGAQDIVGNLPIFHPNK